MPRQASVDVAPVARLFKALGDVTRLRIVALLSHGELCVCHLQKALNLSQPNVSRHLAILRAARLVEHRREGSWVFYRLLAQGNPDRARQLTSLVESFAKRDVLRRDVEKLRADCGPRAHP